MNSHRAQNASRTGPETGTGRSAVSDDKRRQIEIAQKNFAPIRG
jgi:hypothetical protein